MKTVEQQETEAILALFNRIAELEAKVKELQDRLDNYEDDNK